MLFPWSRELAIPSETLNRIDVFHVGTNGQLFGLHWQTRFAAPSIGSLLTDWLNAVGREESHLEIVLAPERVPFLLPIATDQSEEVRYGVTELSLGVGGTMAVEDVSAEEPSFSLAWPPQDDASSSLLSVSPAAESRRHYGEFVRSTVTTNGVELPILVNKRRPDVRSIHVLDRWPGSLTNLLPYGGGLDAMAANAEMQKVADVASRDPLKATRDAASNASRWQGRLETSRLHSWWFPQLAEKGDKGMLWELEGRYGLAFATLDDARKSEDFWKLMAAPRPVRSCHGPLGLLWTLLADRLKAGLSFVRCERCNRIVKAQRRSKRYCGKGDNLVCYRARRASDKRRERAQRKVT